MVIVALVLLVKVVAFGPPLVPTATLYQLSEVGDNAAPVPEVPPVPVSATETVAGLPLVVMLHVALSEFVVVGLKSIDAVQLAEAARLPPQLPPVMAKSPPLGPDIAPVPRVTAPDVPFLMVMVCEVLVAPSLTVPNGKVVGDAVTAPPLAPVPESPTVRGVGLLLEVMLHPALSADVVVGANVTNAVQLADAARLEPQVVDAMAKSAMFAPVMLSVLRVTELAVEFVTVMVCELLVWPSVTVPKDNPAGEAVTAPALAPVPERLTVSGVGLLLVVMLNTALSADVVVGVNFTKAAQLADAARLAPQFVDEIAKSAMLVPVMLSALRVIELAVELVTVMVCGPLVVPSLTVPKDNAAGRALAMPPVPSPESATC